MNNKSILGYKDNSPYKNQPSILIDSNHLTMEGVSEPIIAYPDNNKPVIMKQGKQYIFPNSKKVLEVNPKIMIEKHLETLSEASQKVFIQKWGKASDQERKLIIDDLVKQERVDSFKKGGKKKNMGYQEGGENGISDSSIGSHPAVPKEYSNAEVEDGETVLMNDGHLHRFEGKKHNKGGIPVILNEGDKVFSEHLKAPDDLIKNLFGEKKLKTYQGKSYADLSKFFPTQKSIDILEDVKSDEFEKNGAELKFNLNQAALNTIFESQELIKSELDTTSQLDNQQEQVVNTYQYGGIKNIVSFKPLSNPFNIPKNRTDNFQTETGFVFFEPNTNKYFSRSTDGSYLEVQPNIPIENRNNTIIPNGTAKYPVEWPNFQNQSNQSINPNFQFGPDPNKTTGQYVYDKDGNIVFDNTTPLNKSVPNSANGWQLEYDSEGKVQYNPIGLPSNKTTPASAKKKVVSGVKNKLNTPVNSSPVTSQITQSLSRPTPSFLSESIDPTLYDTSELEKVSQNANQSVIDPFRTIPREGTDPYIQGSEVNLNQTTDNISTPRSRFDIGKIKDFIPGSKLTGTILDIALAASDKLKVKPPTLFDTRKQPLFTRFVEFDNTDDQQILSKSIQQIQNSNLPEQVKQSQIAQLNAQALENDSKVTLNNQARFEDKRERDTRLLNQYTDANIDIKKANTEEYLRESARIEELRDRFNSQRKSRIVNSVLSYLDYVDNVNKTNQLQENYTLNPITDRVKFREKPTSVLTEQEKEFERLYGSNNSETTINGIKGRRINNKFIYKITDKEGNERLESVTLQ